LIWLLAFSCWPLAAGFLQDDVPVTSRNNAPTRGLLLALSLLLLISCGRPGSAPGAAGSAGSANLTGSAGATGPYFDVRGLLDEQVRQLTARGPAVEKQVSLRGGPLETVRVPRVKWADELQLFYQADLNKAALRGAYAPDSAQLPDGSLRRTYTLRPGHDNAVVRQLTVLSRDGQPLRLVATLRQDNVLFSAQKSFGLSLENGQLRAYEVRGAQKLVLFDTLHYQTQARVE